MARVPAVELELAVRRAFRDARCKPIPTAGTFVIALYRRERVVASIRSAVLMLSCLLAGIAASEEPGAETIERTASLRTLFSSDQLDALGPVIAPDRDIRWTLHVPTKPGPLGVIIFVSPSASARPPRGWIEILDR